MKKVTKNIHDDDGKDFFLLMEIENEMCMCLNNWLKGRPASHTLVFEKWTQLRAFLNCCTYVVDIWQNTRHLFLIEFFTKFFELMLCKLFFSQQYGEKYSLVGVWDFESHGKAIVVANFGIWFVNYSHHFRAIFQQRFHFLIIYKSSWWWLTSDQF